MSDQKKTDLRIVKTHLTIRKAFIGILKTTPFEKVAVQDIIQSALINRSTFYKYYSGKSDLAGQMISEFKKEYAALLHERFTTNDWDAFVQAALFFMYENREMLLVLWEVKTRRHHLYDDMHGMIKANFIKYAIEKAGDRDWDYQAEMLATLALNSAKYFLDRNLPVPLNRMFSDIMEALKLVEI